MSFVKKKRRYFQNEKNWLPLGRTDLSIGGIGTTFHALSHRHGPVGPSLQEMPEKSLFHDLFLIVFVDCLFDHLFGTFC